MARFAEQIEIAGVVFTGCKGLLLDGNQFSDSVRGSIDWANDSTPHVQIVDTQYKGILFGISLGSEDSAGLIETYHQTVAAIKAQRTNPGYSLVEYEDEQYVLELRVKPDYNQIWYSYGPFSEGYLKGVTFRFVVVQALNVEMKYVE